MMLKKKKHLMTLTCLVVGMLVLTSAVYANYDDAKGYSNYKEALKQLAFEETNFTADMTVSMESDGDVVQNGTQLLKMADGNSSTYEKSVYMGNTPWESYNYQNGDKSYHYNVESNSYYEGESYKNGKSNAMIPLEDKTSKKAVRFMELLADTMVGDLKNNVVLDSIDEDGTRNYSIAVTGNQIPEVVNAGLSLMFGSASDSPRNVDGDTNIFNMYADDVHIGDAICKVSINEKGRLTANYLEASLVGKDLQGKSHKAVMKIDAKIVDYGKTVADVFDPTGKTKEN